MYCYAQASKAAKQQQVFLKHALGNTLQGGCIFPAGVPQPATHSAATAGSGTAAAGCLAGWPPSKQQYVSGGDCYRCCSPGQQARLLDTKVVPLQHLSQSSTQQRQRQNQPQQQPRQGPAAAHVKPASQLVEACVDDVFAARAAANMPDGAFNQGLSLHQSADYEALRAAADLERRLDRGLVSWVAVGRTQGGNRCQPGTHQASSVSTACSGLT